MRVLTAILAAEQCPQRQGAFAKARGMVCRGSRKSSRRSGVDVLPRVQALSRAIAVIAYRSHHRVDLEGQLIFADPHQGAAPPGPCLIDHLFYELRRARFRAATQGSRVETELAGG
jgi:hypothetical protein